MIRLIVVAFALTLASSAQALPPVSFHQADKLVIPVRAACGAGMHSVKVYALELRPVVALAGASAEKLAKSGTILELFRHSVLRPC